MIIRKSQTVLTIEAVVKAAHPARRKSLRVCSSLILFLRDMVVSGKRLSFNKIYRWALNSELATIRCTAARTRSSGLPADSEFT